MLVLGKLKHPTPGCECNWFSIEWFVTNPEPDVLIYRVMIYSPDDFLLEAGRCATLEVVFEMLYLSRDA